MGVAWDASKVIQAMFAEATRAQGKRVRRIDIGEKAGMLQSEVSSYANGKLLGPDVGTRLADAFAAYGVKNTKKRLVPAVPPRPSKLERHLQALEAALASVENLIGEVDSRLGAFEYEVRELTTRVEQLEAP